MADAASMILLQETCQWDMPQWLRDLGYDALLQRRDNDEDMEGKSLNLGGGLAMLFDTNVHRLVRSDLQSSCAMAAAFQNYATGLMTIVVNVYIPPRGSSLWKRFGDQCSAGDDLEQAARESVLDMIRVAQRWALEYGKQRAHVIVAGDFNARVGEHVAGIEDH